jgi:hypothetical protein
MNDHEITYSLCNGKENTTNNDSRDHLHHICTNDHDEDQQQ